MHVHFEFLIALADHQRVTDGAEIIAQGSQIDIRIRLPHDINRIVGKGDILCFKAAEDIVFFRQGYAALRRRENLSLQGCEHRFQDHQIPFSAGIHHPGLLEHRVEVHRIGKSHTCSLDGANKNAFQIGTQGSGILRSFGSHPGNREDRPFRRLHDRFVGGVDPVMECAGKFRCSGRLQPLEAFGNTAEQQRKNNAGVPSCTPQQCACHTVRRSGNGVKAAFAQLGGSILHGQIHICAGITVRHREDVQLVDLLNIRMKGCFGTENHLFKSSGIDKISQDIESP